jgi:unspecific peroxygenase
MLLLVLIVSVFASIVAAFPSHVSLAGLSREELDVVIPALQARTVEPPPGPLKYNGTKLVNDKDHPFRPARPNDMRGPCPGLNTLASHGVCLEYYFLQVFLMSKTFA